MSRKALVGVIVSVAAGLSGCASPARVIDRDAARVMVAIPDNTNTWPFYYRDEAIRAAAEHIHDPVVVTESRVKVGEELTNTQDTTRRERKFGEVVSSVNTTSVSDKYEYHLEFRSRGPVTVTKSDALSGPGNPAAAGPNGSPVTPAGGVSAGGVPAGSDNWRKPAPPGAPPGTPTHLPATVVPGQK